MPKPRAGQPIPSPLDAVQKAISTGQIGGRGGAAREEAPGDQEISRLGDQSLSLPGDQDTRRLVSQAPSLLGDQETRRLGDQSPKRLVSQELRRPGDQAPISRNAKSSSSEYQKVGVYIRTGIYTRLKVHAALTGRDLSDIANQAFLDYLARNE